MNKKNFIKFLMGLIFCFRHSLIIAMPGVDMGGVPVPVVPEVPVVPQVAIPQQQPIQIPQTPSPVAGRVVGPAVGGARPQAFGAPTFGAPGQVISSVPVAAAPTQYGSETEIISALTEAASPSTPLFNEIPTAKSKITIYKAIFKSLSTLFPNITLDSKNKILDGFYTDVLNSAADLTTYLVSNSALDEIYAKLLGDPSKTSATDDKTTSFFLLNQIQNELRKTTSPSASKYTQMFNKIYTNLLYGRSKLDSQIKKQTDFSNDLNAVRAIDLDKIANKIDVYQRLILNVNKSITLTNRKDLITEIGRFIGLVGDESTRQKIFGLFKFIQANQFFTPTEKTSLADLAKPSPTAPTTTPTQTKGQVTALTTAVQPAQPTQVTAPGAVQPTLPAAPTAPAVKKVVISIDVLKNKLAAATKNYTELIKICSTVINLFPTITSPDNKTALVPLLVDKFNFLYGNRGLLKSDDLTTLNDMFEKAKNISELANVITPERLNSLKLISQLGSASAEKVFAKKIAAYVQIANSINQDIHNFEKGRFIDGITNLFSLRKQMASTDIVALKNLLNSLNSSPFKDKNIFDGTMQKTLGNWIKIIEATTVLFSQIELKPAKDQITLLKSILTNVTDPNAGYERKQLIEKIIPQLFNSRGNLTQEDLVAMKDLFTAIQNTPGLLASNQIGTIVAWINELDSAIKITTEQKIYISALLDEAAKSKDLKNYEKITSLFTPQTPVPVMAAFVGTLNNIFKNRETYDKKKVLNLFQIINLQKLSNGTNLLGPAQKTVMGMWIKILTNETKPVQQQARAA